MKNIDEKIRKNKKKSKNYNLLAIKSAKRLL